MSYNLTAFGSRFNLTFDPHQELVMHSALGRGFDAPLDLLIGVQTEGNDPETFRYLPYARKEAIGIEGAEHFELTDMQTTMTSLTIAGKSSISGTQIKVKITSPFYPGDVKLTTAPFFYVDIELSRIHKLLWLRRPRENSHKGKIIFKLRRQDGTISLDNSKMQIDYSVPVRYSKTPTGEPVSETSEGSLTTMRKCRDIIKPTSGGIDFNRSQLQFEMPYDLNNEEQSAHFSFIWAAYCDEAVLATNEGLRKLKYTEFFDSPEAVVDFTQNEEETIRRRTTLFDSTVSDTSFTINQKNLLAQSFQSYSLNTIWCEPKGDDHDWFSVFEGNCFYNSTVDVEYNNGLFYYCYWPDLLSWIFDIWSRFEQKDEVGSYISHDIGSGYNAMGQEYHHPMECEETCNFLLMLYAHARTASTGKKDAIQHAELAKRLARYLINSDTTGDGIPNHGTVNTIDDATPAVQFAKKNTYIAVKTMCALKSTARIAALYWNDVDFAKTCDERAVLIAKTLESHAWLGDHYAVCIDDTRKFKYFGSWSRQEVTFDTERIPGWDAYSLYFPNGLLYWSLAGEKITDLGLDINRLRTDIKNAHEKSLTEYGCTHSSADRKNVWISQNLWRDFIATALDVESGADDATIDIKDMADRYWNMQVLFNTRGFSKSFIDTYYGNELAQYPRGLTSAGWLLFIPRAAKKGEKYADLSKCDWANEKIVFTPNKGL